jgi:hypothetical protein
MLPSPQASLEHLKKIGDLEQSTLKAILRGMEEVRTDKELAAATVSPLFSPVCYPRCLPLSLLSWFPLAFLSLSFWPS